jgi:plasmid stabilization system protein ParE
VNTHQVLWSPLALSRLDEHVSWVAEHSADAALRLISDIERRVGQLADFPELGPAWSKHPWTGVRCLLCGKHVVYYEVVASLDEVHILTVRHGREQESELEGLKGG